MKFRTIEVCEVGIRSRSVPIANSESVRRSKVYISFYRAGVPWFSIFMAARRLTACLTFSPAESSEGSFVRWCCLPQLRFAGHKKTHVKNLVLVCVFNLNRGRTALLFLLRFFLAFLSFAFLLGFFESRCSFRFPGFAFGCDFRFSIFDGLALIRRQ